MSPLSRDHVVWAYRLLLDRDPESDAAVEPKMRGYGDTRDLRRDMMTSPEFREKNRDLAQANERTVVICPLSSGLRIFVDLADHAIGLNIIRGRFEQDELAFAVRSVGPSDVAIDAGAHVGLFALHLAQAVGPAGHVHAFEPFADNADLLDASRRENGFEDRLTVIRAAVGGHSGSADLMFATHTLNSGGAFLLTDESRGLAGHDRRRVAVVALDDLTFRRPVRFIKLDVEGAEPLVVAGAAALIRADRPAILAEIHREQLARVSGATPESFFAQLAALGYSAHAIEAGGRPGPSLAAPPDEVVATVAFVPGGRVG